RVFVGRVGDRGQVGAQNPILLGNLSEPQPDLAILRPKPDFYESGHPTAADILLVIEVSDTTLAFDRDVKVPLYARQGIPEVWLESVRQAAIVVYRDPSPEGYRTSFTVR